LRRKLVNRHIQKELDNGKSEKNENPYIKEGIARDIIRGAGGSSA
jgi:hypothetical protein